MYYYKVITNVKIKKLPKIFENNIQIRQKKRVKFNENVTCYEYYYKRQVFSPLLLLRKTKII